MTENNILNILIHNKKQNVIPLKKKVKVIDSGKEKEISEITRILIEQEWLKLTEHYPSIFNGPNYCVEQIELFDEQITLTCSRSSYAHYRCGRVFDLGEEVCRNPYGAAYLVTKDGYLVVALQGGDSENEGKIQGIGGGMSAEDFQEDKYILDPEITALRELEEEAGKDIRNSIYKIEPGFLITDGIKFGMAAICYSDLEKHEMENAFTKFQIESNNHELDSLSFWNKENLDELAQYEEKQDLGVAQLIRNFFDSSNK